MAKILSGTGINDFSLILPGHITQSISAFTGTDAYDITISGSLTITGSTNINGLVTATSFSGDGSSISGVTGEWDGTLDGNAEITGSTILLASEASDLSFEINESASFEFLTGAANSGSFIVQTSPDTGKGELQTFFGQGNATIGASNVPNQAFGVKYTSGSGASHGELTMTVGKRDLTNLGSTDLNNFFVAYEPAGILTNAEGELEFHLGDHFKVGNGIVLEYRGGATPTTQTSSFAGYFSSSAFPDQQQYTKPFAISTLSQVSDSNPAFVINKSIDHLTASAFSVDYGGNATSAGTMDAVTGSFAHITGSEISLEIEATQVLIDGGGGSAEITVEASGCTLSGSLTSILGETAISAGNLSVTGTGSFDQGAKSIVSTASISDSSVDPRGDILKAGNTSTSAGLCYFLTGSEWVLANVGSSDLLKSGSMNNLLGIAIGSNSGTDGMLLKGTCNHGLNTGQAEVGKRFYIDSGGRFSGTQNDDPTLRRIAGYTVEGNNKIYFNPEQTTL